MDDMKAKIKELEKKDWPEISAAAWVRTDGRCAYCGADILENVTTYSAGETEHILPKSKYENRHWEILNTTLACKRCNNAKGTWDPNEDDPIVTDENEKITKEQHEALIGRVKNCIKEKIATTNEEFEMAKAIIRPEDKNK